MANISLTRLSVKEQLKKLDPFIKAEQNKARVTDAVALSFYKAQAGPTSIALDIQNKMGKLLPYAKKKVERQQQASFNCVIYEALASLRPAGLQWIVGW